MQPEFCSREKLLYYFIKNKLEKTQNSTKEQPCLPTTSWSYWNLVYVTPTSCSKANSMSKPRGAALGSPVSPVVANLYMEYFDYRDLTSAVNPPRLWKRYVDDTFVILQQSQKNKFLQQINSVDLSINFTTEESRQDGSMPFLDTLLTPQENGTLTTSVYWKPTHTDLYLLWDSHLSLACKYSVINTLTHMAKAVCSNSKLLKKD